MNFNLEAEYMIYASTEVGQKFSFTVEGLDWSYPIV